jgi:hypothetical protein
MNLIETAEDILDLRVEHPTPVRDLLGKLLTDREYTHGTRTKFMADARMSVDTSVVTDRDRGGEVLQHVEVSLSGTFTFDGDEDQYARVVLKCSRVSILKASTSGVRPDWFHTNTMTAWTKAERWKGGSLVAMPEGARKNIAAAVVETVKPFTDWFGLALEDQQHRRVGEINRRLSTAASELKGADELANRYRVPL